MENSTSSSSSSLLNGSARRSSLRLFLSICFLFLSLTIFDNCAFSFSNSKLCRKIFLARSNVATNLCSSIGTATHCDFKAFAKLTSSIASAFKRTSRNICSPSSATAPTACASRMASSNATRDLPVGSFLANANARSTFFFASTRLTDRPSKMRVRFSIRCFKFSFSSFFGFPDCTALAKESSSQIVNATKGTFFSNNVSAHLTIASPSDSEALSFPGAAKCINTTIFFSPRLRSLNASFVP
mmetsp:Transcript_1930/g.6934  ORF Transcript_1930/g.6934 Transcript_1930/m.6934 type:complete len:242 (-) Transcript_1930:1197-1922(-)